MFRRCFLTVALAALVCCFASACASGAVPPQTNAFTVLPNYPSHRLLLDRPEVQRHLGLTLRQKQDLGLTPRSPEQRQKDEKEDVRQLERFRDLVKAAAEARTEELRRQRSQDLEEWTRSETANHQAAQKAAMVKVLRPEQWQRLVELDLQWRGPLALSDPDVVGLVDVNRENYASVAAIAQAFSSSITRAERDFAQDRGYQLLAQAQNNRFSPLRKKADTLKWAAEMLALSLLSDSETQRWIAAQGKPFVFRATQ